MCMCAAIKVKKNNKMNKNDGLVHLFRSVKRIIATLNVHSKQSVSSSSVAVIILYNILSF